MQRVHAQQKPEIVKESTIRVIVRDIGDTEVRVIIEAKKGNAFCFMTFDVNQYNKAWTSDFYDSVFVSDEFGEDGKGPFERFAERVRIEINLLAGS